MDEEDDDIYDPTADSEHLAVGNGRETERGDDDSDDTGSEEDSDDDIPFILNKPDNEPDQQPATKSESNLKPSDPSAQRSRTSASPRPSSTKPTSKVSAPSSKKPGTDFPAIHDTTVDPDAPLPSYTLDDGSSKPLIDLDFDADLAEHTKPWRLPGSVMSDYFNYGFDEFSWATYCLKQQQMRDAISQDDAQRLQMQNALAGVPSGPQGGMPPMPGLPPMPMMPGMPEMTPDMMNTMMQQMQASGMDPSQMDFQSFMQTAQNMQTGTQGVQNSGPPQGAPLGPGQGQQGGYDNRHGGGGRRRGRW